MPEIFPYLLTTAQGTHLQSVMADFVAQPLGAVSTARSLSLLAPWSVGSIRLEEPLARYAVNVVFHSHVHHGAAEGRAVTGIPVYNVLLALMQRTFPDRPPCRIVEMHPEMHPATS
jgi:hypothetical protein